MEFRGNCFRGFLVIQGFLREVGLGFRGWDVCARARLRRGEEFALWHVQVPLVAVHLCNRGIFWLEERLCFRFRGGGGFLCRGRADLVVEPQLLGSCGFCRGTWRGGVKSRGNDGDTEVLAQVGIGAVSPDDFRGLAGSLLDVVGDFHDLVHENLLRAKRDVQQDEVGACDVAVVQKRAFEGVADGFLCASLSRGASRSHDGASAVAHHRVDVVHVHVDFPGQRDDFRNPFGCSAKDLVCVGEGAADGLVAKQLAQLVVADDEQGVYGGAHGFKAF